MSKNSFGFYDEADRFVPELQYMKEISDTNDLDKILELFDEYVDLTKNCF